MTKDESDVLLMIWIFYFLNILLRIFFKRCSLKAIFFKIFGKGKCKGALGSEYNVITNNSKI